MTVNIEEGSSDPIGMVLVRGRSFIVGSDDGAEAEKPRREIALAPYWIDQTLVTNAQFREFVNATGYQTEAERQGHALGIKDSCFAPVDGLSWRTCAAEDRRGHPVVLVSWHDAKAFADWAGKRLPTEWEWEAAASSGKGSYYPWGDFDPDLATCAWQGKPSCPPPTAKAASFAPNYAGLFHMCGNVWQWCENVFDGSEAGLRARRGGAWNVIQDFRLRCANRGALMPYAATLNMGFRCARDI